MTEKIQFIHPARHIIVLGLLAIAALCLLWRAVDLQVLNNDFLQDQGDARHLRVLATPPHRGMILDRNGEPLAISTPVDSVCANPQELMAARDSWKVLARLLDIKPEQFKRRLKDSANREFVYLKRHINPELAQQVMAQNIPGIFLQREYRRYYPAGEVTAHIIGFTNVDDTGQEGLELGYDHWLRGTPGSKRVVKDRLGRVIENVESIREPAPGRNLTLSIDRRIQYLAYRDLKAVIQQHRARSGSAVILDVQTGEVVAMVNQPAFNPNNRGSLRGEYYRNRAVTDVFEPGSTIKPFTIAAALETGKINPHTYFDTTPGYFMVGKNTVRDIHNYGNIDVTTIIQKSSNVGITKIALSLESKYLWTKFSQFGFGALTGSGFPGESGGLLTDYTGWNEIERATLSFGYGLSVTPLQLAQAYMMFADKGRIKPVSFLRVEDVGEVIPQARSVIDPKIAEQVLAMMETVTDDAGTGALARVMGYRVAGKTGTVRKSGVGGYMEDHYIAMFAGIAPASRPRLVMVVVINEPQNEEYYGGQVAAPVFASVMTGALRLLGVAPDDVPLKQLPAHRKIAGLDRPTHTSLGSSALEDPVINKTRNGMNRFQAVTGDL